MAITTDTVQGTIGKGTGELWFHYDIAGDVLYLRLAAERQTQTVAEESPEGFLVLRRLEDDRPVGMTVVNWWKRFGAGARPDSLRELELSIEPWASRMAA